MYSKLVCALDALDLVTLGPCIQEALLDGELQQVVILVAHWLTAAGAHRGVVRRGLEHGRVHLAADPLPWLPWFRRNEFIMTFMNKNKLLNQNTEEKEMQPIW